MPASRQNINLTRGNFPLISKQRGDATLITGVDRQASQVAPFWVENVMPTQRGLQSARREVTIPAAAMPVEGLAGKVDDVEVHLAFNTSGEVTYCITSDTKFLVYSQALGRWEVKLSISNAEFPFSVFFLQGTTWVFHRDLGAYKFGATFANLDLQTFSALSGFNPQAEGNVTAMAACLSYVVAVTDSEVYWSSALNPLEFNPTNDSTAGATKVLALRGKIRTVLPLAQGFVLYTETNAVAATYSNNPRNPWVFREVANSAGVFFPQHVTFQSSLPFHYVWSDSGILQLTPQSAIPQFPEVTEFLSGDTLERFNTETKQLEREVSFLAPKLTYLNSRYLAISYGAERELKEYILLYDSTLQRWGKIGIKHYSVFNFIPPQSVGGATFADLSARTFQDLSTVRFTDLAPSIETSNFAAGSFGVLDENGAVQKIEWHENSERGDAKVLIGGLQLTRARLTTLDEIVLHGCLQESDIEVSVRSAPYNFNWKPFIFVPKHDRFVGTSLGKTHEILLEGNFSLTDVITKLTYDGMD